MLEQFLHHIIRNELFSRHDKVLLAVSGGVDSIVMVHLFRTAGLAAGIAHCNFMLRGEAANEDARFVETLSNDAQMTFHTKSFQTERIADEQGKSIQMAARELRNAWFEEVLREHKYTVVATAHHLNDSLETLLLNLTKGTGVDGMTGIPVKSRQFVRPMLFASRTQIEEYARKESLTWREDSSNETDDYQRNVIRHHVVPVLREINPNLEATFSDTIFRLCGARDFARGYMKEFNVSNMYYDGRHVLIRKEALRRHRFGSVILWELLKDLGFNFDQCRDITEKDHQSGSVFMSPTHRLTVSRDEFILGAIAAKSAGAVEILSGATRAVLEGWSLSLEIIERRQVALTGEPLVARMDLDKLTFPLTWRHWRVGDRFVPLGMSDHKKLSDLLVDEKISLPDKDRITVVESAGSIVWVVGLRLSEQVRVTDSTARVLVLRAEEG